MKNIKTIREFLKIYESYEPKLFIDEAELKKLLMKDKEFANGDVHQALLDIEHEEWQKHDWSYDEILNWIDQNLGALPLLAMYLAEYNYQVGNGGHAQYFDNGYASSNSGGFGSNYKNIETHENFVELFKELDMPTILPSGQKAYDIMSKFDLNLIDEIEECQECNGNGTVDCTKCDGDGHIDCPKCNGDGEDEDGNSCDNCDGNGAIDCEDCEGKGYVTCEECDGKGEEVAEEDVADRTGWDALDTKWYIIETQLMKEFDNYLKSLTLDGEKMVDLIELAAQTQKYNL